MIDIYQIGKTPEELQTALIQLREDFDAHNHDGSSSKRFETLEAETVSARTILIRKTSYTNTASGIWMGLVGNVMKLRLGSATAYLDWNGTALNIVGDISGSTITGGTFQTAATGMRTTITGLSAGINFYNTDGTNIATILPTDGSTLFSATSPNTASRMFQFISFIQNGVGANPMIYLEAADNSTGTILLELSQKGDNVALKIGGATTSAGTLLEITHLGTGMCADFYVNNSSSSAYALQTRSTSSSVDTLYSEHSVATMAPGHFKQVTATVANGHNYYRVLKLNGGGITKSIWISDGYNPNTDGLSGAMGDLCLGGDNGKSYINNNGSTGWTAQ